MAMKASVLYPAACELGESPMWHTGRQSCFWVDIEGCTIYEYKWKEKKLQQWQLPNRVSLIVRGKNNEVLLGMQGGIQKFDLDSGNLSLITDLDKTWHNQRFNDGACDSMDRLWIGTMQLDQQSGTGSVYCISKNNKIETKINQVTISNGLTWSADNARMYYTDSLTREIWSYVFDKKTGEISFEKVVISIPVEMGLPDGIAMDEEGFLWVALWGGYGVGRWDIVTGKMIDFIKVPAPHVISCAFVGENSDQLMITTARHGMGENALLQYPESGHVFIVKPGVKGITVFSCDL